MNSVNAGDIAPPADEGLLVARIRAGDAAAFESLFHEYYASLWGYAIGYVKAGDRAEDAVQNVFGRIWERRSAWYIRDDVRSYLFGAVRNEHSDR